MSTAFSWDELDRLLGSKSRADVSCPVCGPRCTTRANVAKKVLGLWRKDDGAIGFNCVRCPDKGIVLSGDAPRQPRPKDHIIAAERRRQADAEERERTDYAVSVFRAARAVSG